MDAGGVDAGGLDGMKDEERAAEWSEGISVARVQGMPRGEHRTWWLAGPAQKIGTREGTREEAAAKRELVSEGQEAP